MSGHNEQQNKFNTKQQQRRPLYYLIILISWACVLCAAIIQHVVILDIPFDTLKFGNFIVPSVVGIVFGYMIVRILIYRLINKEYDSQAEAREEESNKYQIIELNPSILCGFSPSGKINYINPAGERLTGYKASEITGKNYWDVFYSGDKYSQSEKFFEELKKGVVMEHEMTLKTKDGRQKTISWNATVRKDENGKVVEIYKSGHDISKRKKVEKELYESENKHKMIFNSSLVGIHTYELIDGELIFTGGNPAADRLFAEDHSLLVGKTFEEAFPYLVETTLPEIFKQIVEKGDSLNIDLAFYNSLGDEMLLSVGAFQIGKNKMAAMFQDISERKKSEIILNESEAKFRALFHAANDAIFLMKGNIFVDCNEETLKIFGCNKDEIIGKSPFDFSPILQPDGKRTKDSAVEKINKAINGEPQRFEWKHIKHNGEEFDAEVSLNKIKLVTGVFIQAIVRDISERKEFEKALKKSEEKFRTLVANIPGVSFRCKMDHDLTMIFISNEIETLSGYPADDFIENNKRAFSSIIHPDDRQQVFNDIQHKIDENRQFTNSYRIIDNNNEEKWVFEKGQIILNEKGNIKYLDGVLVDITALKKAEQIQKESEERFRMLAEMLPVGIFEADINNDITYANQKSLELFGYDLEDLNKGLNSYDILHPSMRELAKRNFMKRLNGEDIESTEYLAQKKDGSIFFVLFLINGIFKNGVLKGVRGIVVDISERKKYEDELKLFRSALTNSTDAVGMSTPEGVHWYQNWAFDHLFGDIGSDPPSSLYVDIDVGKKVFDTIKAGNLWTGEVKMYGTNKKVLDILLRAYAIKDIYGNIQALIGVHTDITEQKNAERLLIEKEQRFRYLSEGSIEAIFINYEGHCLEANKAAAEMFGYDSPDEFIGLFWTYVIAPESHEIVKYYIMNNLPGSYEAVGLRKDNTTFPIEIKAKNMPYKDDRVVRVTAIRDISLKKEAEERFSLIAKATNDIFYQWDVVNKKLTWYSDINKILGFKVDEIGESIEDWLDLIHPDDLKHIGNPAEAASNAQGPIIYEYRMKDAAGRWRSWESISIPVLSEPDEDNKRKAIKWFGGISDITKRKAAEEELQQYKRAVECSDDIIGAISPDYRYIFANPAYINKHNLRDDQIVGRKFAEVIGEKEFVERIKPFLDRTLAGETLRFEAEINYPKIGPRIMDASYYPLTNAKNEIQGIVGIARDITDKKKIETTLIESEKKYRTLVEESIQGLLILQVNPLKALYVSKPMQKIIGYTPEEITKFDSEQLLSLLHPRDRDKFFENLKLRSSGKNDRVQNYYCLINKDGSHRHVVGYSANMEYETETALQLTILDITDRIKAEEALKASEEKFAKTFYLSPDSITITSLTDGTIIDINRGFTDLFEYSREEAIGKRTIELNLYRNVDDRNKMIESIKKEGKVRALEAEGISKNGKLFYAEINAESIDINNEKCLLVIVRDITMRKQAEKDIKKLNEMLEEKVNIRTADLEAANQELNDFAHVVSHDLKAPLRGIAQISQWLKDDYYDTVDDDGRNSLDLLIGRAVKMDNLIESVLQYSRAGRKFNNEKVTDLNDVVNDLLLLLPIPDSIGIAIDSPLPSIIIDQVKIEQVFQNLISNAVKYIDKEAGVVKISFTENEKEYIFEVNDNGPGIKPKYFDTIFKIFQTLGVDDSPESTGIGLSIVKKIVKFYGGRIWLESKLGEGTSFYFSLPKEIVGTDKEKFKELEE